MEFTIIIFCFIILLGIVYNNQSKLEDYKYNTDIRHMYAVKTIGDKIKLIEEQQEQERYKKIKETLPKDFHLYYSYMLIGKISYKLNYKGETHIMCGTLDEVENHIKIVLSIVKKGPSKNNYN